MAPDSPIYNVYRGIRILGDLNVEALREALHLTVMRHESLRTLFVAKDGTPVPIVEETTTVRVEERDLRAHPASIREQQAQTILESETRRPFDLAVAPFLRVTVLHLEEKVYILLLTAHSIIIDELSADALIHKLAEVHEALVSGSPIREQDLSIPFCGRLSRDGQTPDPSTLDTQIAYWKRQLAGRLPLLELPTDRQRPAIRTFHGAQHSFELDKSRRQAIEDFSREQGVSLPDTLLAVFQGLLHRYTGQEDILLGAIVRQPGMQRVIGSHDETMVVRTDLSGDPSFREWVARASGAIREAWANRDVSFEQLLDLLQPERSLTHTPLFQVMFIVDSRPTELVFQGCAVQPIELHNGTAKFDLTLSLRETALGLGGTVEFNTDLFDGATIARMIGHFQNLLDGVLADSELPISQLPLLSQGERHQILEAWNSTASPYPQDRCVHQLFEAQADRTPNVVAVIFREKTLTYGELNRHANQLAHHLHGLGVRPEVRVGICMERSLEMVIGLLGILKAGGAYVPLDPSYPPDRLAFMLKDSGVRVLLAQERFLNRLQAQDATVVCLDREWPEISRAEQTNLAGEVNTENLAYVIYTSGSTGRPKGVMIPHKGLTNYLWWCIRAYPVAEGYGAPVHSPLGFDLTITSLFPPLLTGKSVLLVPEEEGVEGLAEVLRTGRDFSLVKITPAHLEALGHMLPAQQAAGRAGALIIGGEMLRSENLSFWRTHAPETRLVNEYGPTETVVGCCVYEVPRGVAISGAVPIGRPIANTQIYVLDRHLEPVPIGVVGELYIGGAGVGRGYLNRPDLTAERFLPDPFSSYAGARLYKTGDLARYRPDGNIEYLGRSDHQVKLRGFRIELGEIEAVVRENSRVRDAVTVISEERHGSKHLVTYIVPVQSPSPRDDAGLISELRASLSAKLPSYMVPSTLVVLEALPLTPNGKVDRSALPSIAPSCITDSRRLVPPGDPLECQLVEIWEDLLGISPIGIRDDFFALGGDSLLAVRMVHRIEQVCGKKLFLTTLFAGATIEHLARRLLAPDREEPGSPLVQVQSGGSKRPFFFLHGDYNGGGFYCLNLARHLGADQPFYALQPHGVHDQEIPLSIEAMAAQYLEVVRAQQPHGPYLLGGYCNGAYVTFELARRLRMEGEKVDLLLLMEASAVNVRFRWLHQLVDWLGSLGRLSPERRFNWFIALRQQIVEFESWLRLYPNRLKRLLRAGFSEQCKIVRRKVRSGWQRLSAGFTLNGGGAESAPVNAGSNAVARPWEDRRRQVAEAYTRAIGGYVPRPYDGEVTVFWANDDPPDLPNDPTLGWGKVARAVDVHSVPGDHLTCLTKHVEILAEQVRVCLQKAQG